MKIAYFAGTVRKGDGTVRVLLEMIEQATRKGMECMVVSGYFDKHVHLKVKAVKIPSVPFPFYQDYYMSYSNERSLAKKLDAFNPDIIHVHSPDLISWAALKYARTKKIPILATHHTDFVKYTSYYHASYLKPVIKTMLKALYNRMGAVTTPSHPMASDLESYGVKNVEITPWGTDLGLFTPKAFSADWRLKITGGDQAKKIILSASRLTWEKDLQVLVDVYNLLKEYRDDFILAVAGDGPIRKELEELMPGALFLGHLTCDEIATAYASSDLFLFPSSTETFGNVTLEAMACGLVPVVAKAGGSLSLVRDGFNGLLADAGDAEDFYRKVSQLLDHPTQRHKMRENAISLAESYSWSNVCNKTFAIYDRLVEGCHYPIKKTRISRASGRVSTNRRKKPRLD
jgi:phosphatidylinositol alpha 1,6-mannosyltransferase